jgi:hypothetical protein
VEPTVEVGVVGQLLAHHQRLLRVLHNGGEGSRSARGLSLRVCAWCVSCLLDELQALEGHLPATHVQAGQDLVVGRRRRVGEERLRERTLDRSLEVLCVG